MDTIKKFIGNNLIWLLTMLVSLGVFVSVVKGHSVDIKALQQRSEAIQGLVVKMDRIEVDIREIKTDLKEIRQTVFRPAFVSN